MCCYATAAQLTTPHLRDLARYTMACGDTVGKIAAECGVGKLVLTHHRPGQTAAILLDSAGNQIGGAGEGNVIADSARLAR